jgi:hypothetical protein
MKFDQKVANSRPTAEGTLTFFLIENSITLFYSFGGIFFFEMIRNLPVCSSNLAVNWALTGCVEIGRHASRQPTVKATSEYFRVHTLGLQCGARTILTEAADSRTLLHKATKKTKILICIEYRPLRFLCLLL